MRLSLFQIFLTIPLFFFSKTLLADVEMEPLEVTEFAHVNFTEGHQDYSQYLDKIGIAKVRLDYRSSENNQYHWTEVVDNNGRILQKFGDNYRVSSQAEGRYRDRAMLFVTAKKKKCKKDCSRYYLFSSDGRIDSRSAVSVNESLDTLIQKNGNFMNLNSTAVQIMGENGRLTKTINSPFIITNGTFGSHPDGNWMAVAVSEDGVILVADENGWDVLNLTLAAHGDRQGVLAVYPKDKGRALITVYRYINEYNKGLYLLDYDMESKKIKRQGWLFNSEELNVGFDPDIYFNPDRNEVVVSATNSSSLTGTNEVYFRLSEDLMNGLRPDLPQHVQESGFTREKLGSFMIGAGISQVSWKASSKVEKNDITYTEVNYLIADSLFISANVEARLGNTSLTINYLKNQAEDLADSEIDDATTNTATRNLAKAASSYLFSTIDFNGLLSPSSSLRLLFEQGETNGVAEVDKPLVTKEYASFTTKYDRIGLISMQERGFYMGGDYVNYTMPSAVGFSDNNGSIVFSDFDRNFEFSSLRFIIGYDALAYARRYETDYSRWYGAGGANIGMGWATLSDEIIAEARLSTGKTKVGDVPVFIVAGGELEFGYVWQKRSKSLGGLGYSSALGYRVNASFLGAGQGEDNTSDDVESLALEFSRFDIFHGFFFKANILF